MRPGGFAGDQFQACKVWVILECYGEETVKDLMEWQPVFSHTSSIAEPQRATVGDLEREKELEGIRWRKSCLLIMLILIPSW